MRFERANGAVAEVIVTAHTAVTLEQIAHPDIGADIPGDFCADDAYPGMFDLL